jgi:hypothetical protein
MLSVITDSVLPNLKSFKYCSDVRQIQTLLPGGMCGGDLKKLRVLDLTNVIIHSDPIRFRGLTSIRLASTRNSSVMLTDQFFDLLINCPRVKSLELARYVFRDTADGTRPPIPLHSLKSLFFVSTDSRFLLSRIDAPSISNLSINGTGSYLPAPGLNPVLPNDLWTLNFTRSFTSLIIVMESHGLDSSMEEIDTGPLSFVVQISIREDAFIPIFRDISLLTLHNVTLLSLNRGHCQHPSVWPVTPQMIVACFANLPSLGTLKVVDPFWFDILRVRPLGSNVTAGTLCPLLHTISVFIERKSYLDVFQLLKLISTEREKAGRGHIRRGAILNYKDDHLLHMWNSLSCDPNRGVSLASHEILY